MARPAWATALKALGEPDATPGVARRVGRPPAFLPQDLEPIMPAQWFKGAGQGAALQPEKRLMLAVLSDAIELVLGNPAPANVHRVALRRNAAEWIRSRDRCWAFSFENICEALGFEPDHLREGIARLVARRADMPLATGE